MLNWPFFEQLPKLFLIVELKDLFALKISICRVLCPYIDVNDIFFQ